MKAIQTGHKFSIYDDSMKLHNELPAQVYRVEFGQFQGFYLTKFSDIEVNEKVYGVHLSKVNKTLNAFKNFERNLGVILSGDKGIGKSLFSKVLAQEAIKQGYPLLIVNSYIPRIADFLNDIKQEVVVLFDEFDKTFPNKEGQAEMLTLFDGISQGKKLFCITCNELNMLNHYLVNRPGRFHYHYRFEYPTAEEIREYLHDKLAEIYYSEIEKVVGFSHKIKLNYDCLRAIAFELNSGLSFENAIADLNILRVDHEAFTLTLLLNDGTKLKVRNAHFDPFDEDELYYEFEDESGYDIFDVTFRPSDSKYIPEMGTTIIASDLKVELQRYIENARDAKDPDYDENKHGGYNPIYAELRRKYKDLKATALILQKRMGRNIHYSL